jgi:hypothetical protein
MEPIEYNDQLGEHLVRHLLFDPHADLFDGLQELSKLPTGVVGANGTAQPQTTTGRRTAEIDSSSSDDEQVGVLLPGAKKRQGGSKFKRLLPQPSDGALVDRWGQPIEPAALVLPDAPLVQYAPLYPQARFAAANPATMGTSLDMALLMLLVAFGAAERIDPQLFVVTAGIITSPMVFRIYAIRNASEGGPVVALSLNVQVIWRLVPEKVQLSMIYAALSLKAFSEWWARNHDRRPSVKEIDRYLDTPSVVLKLKREDALPSRSDYVPLFELDPPVTAVNNNNQAVLDGWIANAKARFGLPQITALAIQFGNKKGAHKRMDIASSNAIVVRNGLFEQFAETDVVQLLLVAFVRWCRRHLNALDTTDRYVNAGGRLDLLFSKTFEKTFIA